jgi:hypothetical protein
MPRALLPALTRAYVPALLVLLAVVVLRLTAGVPMAVLTRDPSQVTGTTPLLGAVSSLGMVLWAGTGSVCLFVAAVLRRRRAGAAPWTRFFAVAGVLTFWLLADDLFLLHDVVFPDYFHLDERLLYLIYGGLMVAFLLGFLRRIRESDYPVLLLALGFFALSLGFDVLTDWMTLPGEFLLEDGCKFLGIVGWATYFIRTARRAVVATADNGLRETGAAGPPQ